MKKQKRVLIYAKFEAEKISSTEFQGILKSKSEILRFAKLSVEKGNLDDCHAIEEAETSNIRTMEIGNKQ